MEIIRCSLVNSEGKCIHRYWKKVMFKVLSMIFTLNTCWEVTIELCDRLLQDSSWKYLLSISLFGYSFELRDIYTFPMYQLQCGACFWYWECFLEVLILVCLARLCFSIWNTILEIRSSAIFWSLLPFIQGLSCITSLYITIWCSILTYKLKCLGFELPLVLPSNGLHMLRL